MSFIPHPYSLLEEYGLALLVSLSIIMGFTIIAYGISYSISKLIKKRKIFWRLLAWTIFLPLCFSLAASCIWLITASSEQEISTGFPDLLALFSGSVLALFKVHSLTALFAIIWLLGVLLIIRKNLYVTIKSKHERH